LNEFTRRQVIRDPVGSALRETVVLNGPIVDQHEMRNIASCNSRILVRMIVWFTAIIFEMRIKSA